MYVVAVEECVQEYSSRSLCTLPLKISIDIIMKSIRSTPPKKLNTRTAKEKERLCLATEKNEWKRNEKDETE